MGKRALVASGHYYCCATLTSHSIEQDFSYARLEHLNCEENFFLQQDLRNDDRHSNEGCVCTDVACSAWLGCGTCKVRQGVHIL